MPSLPPRHKVPVINGPGFWQKTFNVMGFRKSFEYMDIDVMGGTALLGDRGVIWDQDF